jgi:HSP20 family molecular chaperone IbpA
MSNNFVQLLSQTISALDGGNTARSVSTIFNDVLQQSLQPCDIVETEKKIIIYFDMPGVLEDTINVDFDGNKITITGDRVSPYSQDNVIRKEIVYGTFENNIDNLPITITSKNSVDITLTHGVLQIEIDKANEDKNRFRIGVKKHKHK